MTRELTRYCPECGSVGGNPAGPACCPDHAAAMMVSPEIAKQARRGFESLYLEGFGQHEEMPKPGEPAVCEVCRHPERIGENGENVCTMCGSRLVMVRP